MLEKYLNEALRGVSDELRICAQQLAQIENSVATLLVSSGTVIEAETRAGLQNMDSLSQSLNNLTDYLTTLSVCIPTNLEINEAQALSVVRLAAMRERLRHNSQVLEKSVLSAGKIDLF